MSCVILPTFEKKIVEELRSALNVDYPFDRIPLIIIADMNSDFKAYVSVHKITPEETADKNTLTIHNTVHNILEPTPSCSTVGDCPPKIVPKEEIDLTGNIYEILLSPISPPIAVKTLVPNDDQNAPPKEVLDQNGNVYGLVSSSLDPLVNGNGVPDENEVHLKRKLGAKEDEREPKSPKKHDGGEDGDDEEDDDYNGLLTQLVAWLGEE